MGSVFSCGRSHKKVKETLNKCEKRLRKYRKQREELRRAVRDQEESLKKGLKTQREDAKMKYRTQKPTEDQILSMCTEEVREKIKGAQKNISDWGLELVSVTEKIALLEQSQKVLQNGLESTEETEDDEIISQALRVANRQTQRKEYYETFAHLSDVTSAQMDERVDNIRQVHRLVEQNNSTEMMEKDRLYDIMDEVRTGNTSIIGGILDQLDDEDEDEQHKHQNVTSNVSTSSVTTPHITTQQTSSIATQELVQEV